MAADYRSVKCPYCGALLRSKYRADTTGLSITRCTCPKCKKQVKVEHGKGHVKSFK